MNVTDIKIGCIYKLKNGLVVKVRRITGVIQIHINVLVLAGKYKNFILTYAPINFQKEIKFNNYEIC